MSQQINLINPLLLKKRYAFGLREMVLGAGFALAVALAWTGWLHTRASVVEAQAVEREARQAAAQQMLDRQAAAAARPASVLLAERVRAAEARVAERQALLDTLGGTLDATSTGFAPRMRALAHGRVEGVWLNAFTLAPDHLVLKGSALEAGLLTRYLDRLGRQAPFAGMSFAGMQAGPTKVEPGAGTQVEFSLTAGLPARDVGEVADER